MFDAHILYYAYDNVQGDDFGVGYLGNKEFWVHVMNGWQRNDGIKHRYTIEEWDDLDCEYDFRGCILAEIVPDDGNYIVSWSDGSHDFSVIIDSKWNISWEDSINGGKRIPAWVNKLKSQIKYSIS